MPHRGVEFRVQHIHGLQGSGQPKPAEIKTGRNRNKYLRKAEASAETEASVETFILAKIHCFGQITVLANQFILCPSLFWTQID